MSGGICAGGNVWIRRRMPLRIPCSLTPNGLTDVTDAVHQTRRPRASVEQRQCSLCGADEKREEEKVRERME